MIFEKAQLNKKSEFLTYEKFITASIDRNKLISENKLRQAFNVFDKEKKGEISAKELKEVLDNDKNHHESLWTNIIKEIDSNGDGVISFEEFRNSMIKLLVNDTAETKVS